MNVRTLTLTAATLVATAARAEVVPYTFPPYEKVEGLQWYADEAEYRAALSDKAFRFEKLRYASDGLSVVAYLYRPVDTKGLTLPLILFCRGSGPMGDVAPNLIAFFHRLASKGYVVLAPQYRQGDGGEGKDEIGGADLDDVKNALPLAASLGYVDMRNVFLYGESRGGMMTYQAIRDGLPARAAAVFGAFTDLELMVKDPRAQKLVAEVWPDWDARKDEIVRRRSVKYWPEKLGVPVLIMNGNDDAQVDASQPLGLALQLQALKKEYGLVLYSGGNHLLTKDRHDRDARALDWFERHKVR